VAARVKKSCNEKALELLSRRPHFRRELERKLQTREYSTEEVEATLARMEEYGYLNELETARAFVRQRLRRGPEGRSRLQAELGRRGAASEAASAALEELVPQDDRDLAKQAAETWLRRGREDSKALARYLQRKGFSSRAIFSVLEDAAP